MIKFHLPSRLILCIVCLTVSCIDPIELEVPAGLSGSLVVQGRIVLGEPSYVEVGVSRLFDFSPESRQPVSVKNMMLFDDNNNEMLLETRTPGNYRVELNNTTPVSASLGGGYKIRFDTFDNRTYESGIDFILPNNKPDGLHVSRGQIIGQSITGQEELKDVIYLTIDTDIETSSGGGIFWEVNNIFKITDAGLEDPEGTIRTCYIDNIVNVNDIHVLKTDALNVDRIENYELGSAPLDFKFAEGLFYEARQFSLGEGAFKYWSSVNSLSEREGGMFDGPVGEIPSNIFNINDENDIVFGYFFAAQEELIRIKVPKSVTGELRLLCDFLPGKICFGPSGGCICGLCCDCRLDPGSDTIPPPYWFE